ncbi:MAG: hypothetical protein UR50_C0015G0012 [Parcubacteria group bacterium GW2011_GWC1_34_10]|nr:MAG: hypothetical protein UR50_C0015G0012 [Parcubacteria group bacterium GW2011_GWC1_34_10]
MHSEVIMKNDTKQRLTVFVDPNLVKRAKVRGALEGLTISEVVEQALDAYAPNIEKASDRQIYVKFPNYPVIITSKSPVKK